MSARVRHQIRDGVGRLTLVDVEHRNALSQDLVDEARAAHSAFVDAGVGLAVLAAEGPVWCAGRDPEAVRVAGVPPAGATFIDELDASPLCWVAAVDGAVLGAGIHLMTTAMWVVLSDDSTLAVPEMDAGIYPRPVGEELASLLGPRRAMELILTRTPLPAAAAVGLGLANEAVPAHRLDAAVTERLALLSAIPEALRVSARAAWRTRLARTPSQ